MANTPVTPMMKQYFEIKEEHPDCLLFFRLGDFYEMFYDDAEQASKELDIALTGRSCGQKDEKGEDVRAPMCGVPYHSCETYIARLVARGHKVAICEQTEDPKTAKGLVKRDVVRVITPGTIIEGSMLDEGQNNYLCTIFLDESGKEAGLCFADCSTGDIHLTNIEGADIPERIINDLARFEPREVLISRGAATDEPLMNYITGRLGFQPELMGEDKFEPGACERLLQRHFKVVSVDKLGLGGKQPAVKALGCLLSYLYETQMSGLERLNHLDIYTDVQFMRLDATARRNLELTETMRGQDKRASLLGVLDRTKTAMGKRMIRAWIEQPLIHPAQIFRRQNAVEELVDDSVLRGDLRELLSGVHDLERIMTRIVYGSANARELVALKETIQKTAPVKWRLQSVKSELLQEVYTDIDPLEDVMRRIGDTIDDNPPVTVREGGMVRKGYSAEVDELQEIKDSSGDVISRLQAKEREKTGIKNLRVGYNRVFGYYIEISKSYTGEVPEEYMRKQTVTNAERYVTDELKVLEAKMLTARDRLADLEYQIFSEVRTFVAGELHRVQQTAQAIARLDVLCSFAEVAVRGQYARPVVDLSGGIEIHGGRHPVVESLQDAPFVPNDTLMDKQNNRILMITGPNMAGKSTYMRQTAIIVLMAQVGCFVPADSATIGIVDSIFTRVGASDDLSSGQSTFMVEMSEVAAILKNATSESLIVFDEIGRGTSTFDGMSIARAVLEYVSNRKKLGCKALFATHYHELTALEGELDGVVNYNIAVKKRGDDITFLRRIVRGAADDSYGIQVAKLAGVPDSVVQRAKEVLASIEADDGQSLRPTPHPPALDEPEAGQLSLLAAAQNPIIERLKQLDVETLTPIEALQILFELHKEALNC